MMMTTQAQLFILTSEFTKNYSGSNLHKHFKPRPPVPCLPIHAKTNRLWVAQVWKRKQMRLEVQRSEAEFG